MQRSPRTRWPCLALPRLLSDGDLAGAAACFCRDACLVTQDATAIHGRDHIRPALGQLVSRGTRIEVGESTVLAAGEVGWARERWTIRSRGPDGSEYEQSTIATMLLRRVEDCWKVAIAAPWQ